MAVQPQGLVMNTQDIGVSNICDNLSILSFNTTGWNSFKGNLINTILLSHSVQICLIQEHFLLDSNIVKLKQSFQQYDVFSIPAVKSNFQIHGGRPSGGLAIIFHKNISRFITHLSCPNSHRVHGIKLNLPQASYLFINCYFPVDKRNADNDELLLVLQDIRYMLGLCDELCNVFIIGDLNFDPSRNTDFVNLVKNFLVEFNFVSAWSKFECDFTQCQTRLVNGVERSYFSTIDHFCVRSDFIQSCITAVPLHFIDNTSNHEPIFLKFSCVPVKVANVSYKNVVKPCTPIWNKASIDNINDFKCDLHQNLSQINSDDQSLHCRNLHCNEISHLDRIESYALEIMEAISQSVDNNIPFSMLRPDSRSPVPGWTQFVKPFKDDAYFWFSVWKSAGKPENCVLHDIMKRTRNKYHYAIRKVRKHEKLIRKESFLDDCLSGKINDICGKLKMSRKNKTSPASTVDGESGRENVGNLFKNIYDKVYNKYNGQEELLDLLDNINSNISNSDLLHVDRITESLISDIIYNLQSGKSDINYNWGSDALKFGVHELSLHLTILFRSCLIHGHIPQLFAFCSLVPLVKSTNKSLSSSDNYRMIAISSLFLKILDHIILTLYRDSFVSPHLQFGFQRDLSTTMCTWALLESINFFTNRDSALYVCLLDLTKAFDHVKHDILFSKLRTKVPDVVLRLIIVTYLFQSCSVKWDHWNSDKFMVTNGVRQGAVASPLYFNIYLDDLFIELKNSGLGCRINSYYYGMLAYADDCALLCPSREGLQEMLNICSNYFLKHGIKISVDANPKKSKTKCLVFNGESETATLSLYNIRIPWVKSAIHLGHLISTNEDTSADILRKRGEFISKIHELRQELGDQHPEVFMQLVQIYYTSMYGSNLWDLFSNSANKLFTSWNVLIRSTYNLPYATHRYILYNLCDIPHLRVALIKRFIRFYNKLQLCFKPEIVHLFNLQKSNHRSAFGSNCIKICDEYNVTNINFVERKQVSMPIKISDSQKWRVPLLYDLMALRDNGSTDIPEADIVQMINFICCN